MPHEAEIEISVVFVASFVNDIEIPQEEPTIPNILFQASQVSKEGKFICSSR
jgi:hypothetical protein